MNINGNQNWVEFFQKKALQQTSTILIGISEDASFYQRLRPIMLKFLINSNLSFVLVGKNPMKFHSSSNFSSFQNRVETITDPKPEQRMASLIFNQSNLRTDHYQIITKPIVVIRGALSSSKFLAAIKNEIRKVPPYQKIDGIPLQTISRLALLETAENFQFFFGGVGIDEVNSFESKRKMIGLSRLFFERLKHPLHIGLLSGGRLSDEGRDAIVDQSLSEAKRLEKVFTEMWKKNPPDIPCSISHYEILIEQAISHNVDLLIAPNGISGNLIYRTLVHLGKGRSFGAVYLNLFLHFNRIVIDCSRVAPSFEIEGAIGLAAGLVPFMLL